MADDQGITLGMALDYVPPLTIARSSMAALEIAAGPEPTIAIVNDAGRRFEIRPDHLRASGLANSLAALWPEVPWRIPV